jgi:hypothetical protein
MLKSLGPCAFHCSPSDSRLDGSHFVEIGEGPEPSTDAMSLAAALAQPASNRRWAESDAAADAEGW